MKTYLLGLSAISIISLLSLIISKPYLGLNTHPSPKVLGIDGSKELSFESIEEARAPKFIEVPKPKIVLASAQTKPSPRPTSKPINNPSPSKFNGAEVISFIEKYAAEYGVNKDIMIAIARCESGFNANAVGKGIYGGIFQFLTSTWVSNRKAMGLDPDPNLRFNPQEAARTAAFKMARDGFGAWPVCSKKTAQAI